MTELFYPTSPTAKFIQAWGNANPKLYANGRHMGVDIASNVGTPIFAACAGIADEVNLFGAHGYGRHVIIEHGDFKTLYAHLHKTLAMQGQVFTAGALLGEMGGDPTDADPIDGASTGPHLHFEVLLPKPVGDCIKTPYGYSVDPFPYLLNRFNVQAKWRAKITEKSGVRVRSTTDNSISWNVLDVVQANQIIELTELVDDGKGNQWGRVRALRPEFICVEYQKRTYASLEPIAVANVPEPVPASDSKNERDIRLDEVRRMIVALQVRAEELK